MARYHEKKRQKVRGGGGAEKSVVASKFMSIVPDDLLIEILLRLPNARSVLQYTVVCKRWCSLILSPEFSFCRRFIEYHRHLKPSFDPSYLPDHTFAFFFKFSASETDPSYRLSSSDSRSRLRPKLYFPSFIPSSVRLAIRASSGDLILLSEGFRRYYICNSLTRQWFLLPEFPPQGAFADPDPFIGVPAFALVRYPSNTDAQSLGSYRVVVLRRTSFLCNRYQCVVVIFNSETRLWTESCPFVPFKCPRYEVDEGIQLDIQISPNGVLYWLEGDHRSYHGMVRLDPATVELRLIPLPAGQFLRIRTIKLNHKVQTGVVRGRIRVSRIDQFKSTDSFRLRVWELDCGDDTWELVHDIRLPAAGASLLFLLAFDPNDGDAVFVVRDWTVFRYEIGHQKLVKVCRFPRGGISSREEQKKTICKYLKVFPLVHPLWPTSLPE